MPLSRERQNVNRPGGRGWRAQPETLVADPRVPQSREAAPSEFIVYGNDPRGIDSVENIRVF